jgi:2,4-dienoyl-CoA reductase-like NADH-dependent reductase (Old Yellow Enzyme family)
MTQPTSPQLFRSIKMRGITLPNRIVIAPMCQYSADEGRMTDWHLAHLGQLAMSGAGMLIIEATAVEPIGRITAGCVGLWDDDTEAAMRRVIQAIRPMSSMPLALQLGHAGRKASSQRPWEGGQALPSGDDPWQTIGPSAIPNADGWHVPRAMQESDYERVRDAFVAAAVRAVRVGFEVIEIHAAHGYLFHQTLSPIANQRTDLRGGDRAHRAAFLLERGYAVDVVSAFDAAVSPRNVAVLGRAQA